MIATDSRNMQHSKNFDHGMRQPRMIIRLRPITESYGQKKDGHYLAADAAYRHPGRSRRNGRTRVTRGKWRAAAVQGCKPAGTETPPACLAVEPPSIVRAGGAVRDTERGSERITPARPLSYSRRVVLRRPARRSLPGLCFDLGDSLPSVALGREAVIWRVRNQSLDGRRHVGQQ